MIDLSIERSIRDSNAKRAGELGITIPTFSELKNPEKADPELVRELASIPLNDLNPKNLFRVTWKNEPKKRGGAFSGVNYMEFPREFTGVDARIIGLVGRWFPTGAHKVGAAFGCLVPRLVTGQFDILSKKAAWPSTGNYCRGGAYLSKLLGCESIAILPEEMSRERFEWLSKIASEVIATPGCESNVKEIFDKCWELKATRDDVMIFNQFEELGNQLWHYDVTGAAIEEIAESELGSGGSVAGVVVSSGSAGTTGAGYYIRKRYPGSKLAVSEALQCSTLLDNGFGGHRIEGIGDKHIPFIHDLKSTDMVLAIDDEHPMRLMRLFNERKGHSSLKKLGLSSEFCDSLSNLGISSIANLISSIKFSKYFELGREDIVFTVFTDSMEMYGSRLKELEALRGVYAESDSFSDLELLRRQTTDNILELSYRDKKRIHNLKYYTWVEQQGREAAELTRQWYDHENYWGKVRSLSGKLDELICEFNEISKRSRR